MTADLQEGAPPAVAQYASEAGHWYDPKTGQQVELPRGTWAKTAIKKGYVPGVTTITRQVAKGGLERWKINRAISLSLDMLIEDEHTDDTWITWPDERTFQEAVWQKLDAESEAIMGRGKELHAAIEQAAQGNGFDVKWIKHIDAIDVALLSLGIDIEEGNSEHSFATERYGGKIDWHNDTWLLDFKTKDRIEQGKKLAYPEHALQLAAYAVGITVKEVLPEHYQAGMLAWVTGRTRRCANVFVGVEDAAVHVHEWKESELVTGWLKFQDLLNFWWRDKR
jgi:hypothetical protein